MRAEMDDEDGEVVVVRSQEKPAKAPSSSGSTRRNSPASSPRSEGGDVAKHSSKSALSNSSGLSTSPGSAGSGTAQASSPSLRRRGSSKGKVAGGRDSPVVEKAAKASEALQAGEDGSGDEDDDSDLDESELITMPKAGSPSSPQRQRTMNKKGEPTHLPLLLRRRASTAPKTHSLSFEKSSLRRKKDTSLRDVDESVFRFWMLAEDFKRHKDKQAKAYLAEILYSQYLAPSAESSNSPYYVSALHMPAGIIESIEKGLNPSSANFLPRNLFDTAQAEVWRYMRKRPFPTFLKHVFNAALFCSNSDALLATASMRDANDAEKRKLLKQRSHLKLKIPDALFSYFVRFVTEEEWDIDEEALDEEDDVALEYDSDEHMKITTSTIKELAVPCYRGHGTLNAPPHKALDIISSIEERCCWDDMYVNGHVEEVVGEPAACLLKVDTVLSEEKERSGSKCEQLVLRTVKQLKDGSCILLWRSVEHPDHLERDGTLRLEDHLSGFLLQPHPSDPKKSTVYSLSMLDTKGATSPELMRALNLMNVRLPHSINRYLAQVEKGSLRLASTKLVPPLLLLACYDCNCPWNPWPEDAAEKEDKDGSSSGVPRLSCKEGDSIILLEQGPDPNAWIGYSSDCVRGVFDIDYFRYTSATEEQPPSARSGTKDRSLWNPHYSMLIELISRQDLAIITALCAATDTQVAERLAYAFLYVLRLYPGKTIPLLVNLIACEVRKTGIIQGSTLFRGNDIASHLLSAYCQLVGRKYLMKVIRPLVEKVLSLYAQNKSMEIDPARVALGEDIDENAQNLTDFCGLFLNAITGSLKHCPRSFRVICYYLQREVSKKFPHSKYIVLAGFFFLRFISPAVVSPEAFGLIDENVSGKCRRGLVLVSKVIQNLANGVLFGEKEEHMCRLNPFIQTNLTRFEAFFEEIVTSSGDEDLQERQLTTDEAYPCACYLHAAICRNLNQIATRIATMERVKKNLSNNNSDGSLFLRLLEALIECGPPTVEYDAEDPRVHIQNKKLFVSKKSRPSSRHKRKEKEKERSDGKATAVANFIIKGPEKSRMERERERLMREREKDIENTRAERSREKLDREMRPQAAKPRSSSDRDLRSVSLASRTPSFRENAVQPLPLGTLRSGDLQANDNGGLDFANGGESAKEKDREKGSAFLKISMIKKNSLIERLSKIKYGAAGKEPKDIAISGPLSVVPTREDEEGEETSSNSNREEASSGEEDNVVTDGEEDAAAMQNQGEGGDGELKKKRRRRKDDVSRDRSPSVPFLSSSAPGPSKPGSTTPRRSSRVPSSKSLKRTRSSGKEKELDKEKSSSSSSSKHAITQKAGRSVMLPLAPLNPMMQVICSHEAGTDPAVTMNHLSKQLEPLHEERVWAFREAENFFMSQAKLSLSLSPISSPISASAQSISPRRDFHAMLSPRTDRLPSVSQPLSPHSSPYIVEEFRKLMSVFEDKVRQEERLIQAIVLLSSMPADGASSGAFSPTSTSMAMHASTSQTAPSAASNPASPAAAPPAT